MGGRGSSSSSNGGRISNGVLVEGKASNQKRANELIKGVTDVLSDFGMSNELNSIYYDDEEKGTTLASTNGLGDLRISNKYLKEGSKASKGHFTSATYYGLGAHEAGHAIVYGLTKNKVIPNASILEKTNARRNGSLEKAIIKEAKKRYGSDPSISRYASTSVKEKVAEAVSDVYGNKKKANPYSKIIVDVMKDINTGKFKPKIRLSKSTRR